MKIIIPARKGSKGLPFKNRKLFQYTADSIPEHHYQDVVVTTDDEKIMEYAQDYGFIVVRRPDALAQDTTSIRDVIVHALKETNSSSSETVVVLYLTYPERTWEHVEAAIDYYIEFARHNLSDSLLCKKEIKTHPYLCLLEHGVDGAYGKQLITHDLYRRQDYPKCFEISHYISIFTPVSINKLNSNLYCDSTVFYEIPDVVDVDTKKDFDLFDGRSKN